MAALPYMPLYVADYLADAAHLSTLEHGAYFLLIITYWQKGKPLPASDERLARIARVTIDEWMSMRDTLAEFFTADNNHWVHKRIEQELQSVKDKSEKAKAAGRASAERRLNGRSTDAEQTFNHTDTDTDTDTKEKDKDMVKSEDLPEHPPDEIKNEKPEEKRTEPIKTAFGEFWRAYPKKRKKKGGGKGLEGV